MFEDRSRDAEYLDHPDCDADLSLRSYQFMERVNLYFGGIGNVRRFIRSEVNRRERTAPLRVLDIGSGSCDIPMAILRWSRDQGVPVHFTCIEKSANAVNLAEKKIAGQQGLPIELKQDDIFTHQPTEPYDCAVASMCCHHFEDEQILALMERLRRFVRSSVLINDLRRSALSVLGSIALTAFSHQGVKHDARLSVRRGFTTCELRKVLTRLDSVSVEVSPAWLFRVCGVVRFEGRELP